MKSGEQQKGDPQVTAIRRAIDVRLKARMRDEAIARAAAAHPDEDVINAYVEGWLEESKADSLTSHLVSCASCLHLTAQLIRFDPEMDEAAAPSADVDRRSVTAILRSSCGRRAAIVRRGRSFCLPG